MPEIATRYRVVQECLGMFSDGSHMLYVYPTHYETWDEAIDVVANAAQAALAVHNNNPADPQYEYFGDENCVEVFYRNETGEKVVTDRFHICPIEYSESAVSIIDGYPVVTKFYTYRNASIRVNDAGNRFSITAPDIGIYRPITRHKLDTALQTIDHRLLSHATGKSMLVYEKSAEPKSAIFASTRNADDEQTQ